MVKKTVVADSDAIIALSLEKDPNHKKAVRILANMVKSGADVIFPVTVFPEAITTLVRALNQPQKAKLISRDLNMGRFHLEYLNPRILKKACTLFENTKSKQNTFFDAIVASTAEYLKTDMIFSFDNWYSKIGFKLPKG